MDKQIQELCLLFKSMSGNPVITGPVPDVKEAVHQELQPNPQCHYPLPTRIQSIHMTQSPVQLSEQKGDPRTPAAAPVSTAPSPPDFETPVKTTAPLVSPYSGALPPQYPGKKSFT
jgi:hypothetical protein